MSLFEMLFELFKGLINNFIIVFFAAILPITLGVLFSLIVKKNRNALKVFEWVKIPFESVSIPILIYVLYFTPWLSLRSIFLNLGLPTNNINNFSSFILVIFALTFAYAIYIPSRYNYDFSFSKNILYNSLGLISALFKWSVVASLISIPELLKSATYILSRTYKFNSIAIAFFVFFILLLNIEIGKRLIKQYMK